MASGTITLQNVLDTLASEIDAIASSITALNNKVAFVDNLTSTNASLALSANQGRVLKGLIDSITSDITNINQAINNITTGGGSGGSGSSINVIDNLTSTSALDALSAKQGKILKDALEAFISTTTTNLNNITTSINNISSSMPGITDNLTSTSTTDALSAKQGKVLKDLIDSIGSGSTTNINVIDNLTSDSATDALSAKQGKELKVLIDNISGSTTNINVIDNLTSDSATDALSAKQGKVLDNKIPQIVNALDSSEITKALSAKQGKVLKDNLDNLSTSVTSLQTNLSNLSQSVGSMNTSINNMQTAISSLQNAIPLTLNETVNKTTEELNTYLATLENKKGIVDITLTTAGDDTLNISVPTFDGVLRIRGITTTKSTIGTLTIDLGFTGRLEIYSLNYTLDTAGYRNGAATYLRSQDTSIKVPSTGCSIYGGILIEMTGTGTMEAVSGTPTLNLGWGTKFDTNASQTISNINITCGRLASCNILATLVNTTITKQTTAGANISDIPSVAPWLNVTVDKTTEELLTYLDTLANKRGTVTINLTTAGSDTLNIVVPAFDGVLRINGIATKSTIGILSFSVRFTGRLLLNNLKYTIAANRFDNGPGTFFDSYCCDIQVPNSGITIFGGMTMSLSGTGTIEAVDKTNNQKATIGLSKGSKLYAESGQTFININILCSHLASSNVGIDIIGSGANFINSAIVRQSTALANIQSIVDAVNANGGGGPEILYKENATDAFAQSVLTNNQDKIYFYKEQYV